MPPSGTPEPSDPRTCIDITPRQEKCKETGVSGQGVRYQARTRQQLKTQPFDHFMDKLKKTFQECIGIPIPAELLPDIELLPCLDKKAEDALLFGTAAACKKPFLMQGQIEEFLESAPYGYYLVGFWGHGVNSYAFYYARVDARSRVFFRLPYGGVYMNNEEMASQMRAFLYAFLTFEKEIGQKSARLVAVDAMDYGYYALHSPSGGK